MILGQVYAVLAGAGGAERDAYVRKALAQSALLREREQAAAAALGNEAKPLRTEFSDFVGALAWSYAGNMAAAQPFIDSLEAQRRKKLVSPSIWRASTPRRVAPRRRSGPSRMRKRSTTGN